jgi:hypothetical protein
MVSITQVSRRSPEETMLRTLKNVRTRPWLFTLVVTLALLIAGTGVAQDEAVREGYFEVRSASTTLVGGVYTLDARLQLVLSNEALEALSSGVPLTIELQLQVIRSRRLYFDSVDAELAIRYELEYRPVSQRYIVRNLNSGDQDSFSTLYSALNNLGRVQGLPAIDNSLLVPDRPYRFRLRAMLNTQQYPAPLRLLLFWRSEWQLQSEWIEWPLER